MEVGGNCRLVCLKAKQTDAVNSSEVRSFYFSNPGPYSKVKPRPDDAPKREFSFDDKGNIVVKNLSAYWLPDVKIVDKYVGTEYTVTGSYEGTETLDKKLKRIMMRTVSRRTPMSNDVSLDINQKFNPVQTVAPTKEGIEYHIVGYIPVDGLLKVEQA